MKALLLVAALAACAFASVIQTKPERKLADESFLQRQKRVLDLLVGLQYESKVDFGHEHFDLASHVDDFTEPKVVEKFLKMYKYGFLPKDSAYSLHCHHTRKQTIRLFDLFFYAKDFETFCQVACWARNHVHPGMFYYAFSVAIAQRPDCRGIVLPPMYEVMPNYYVPTDTMMKFFKGRLQGVQEMKVEYNNTGYVDYYHTDYFGGLFGPHADFGSEDKVSYIREDVGISNWFVNWLFRNPGWLCPDKYKLDFFKRGENFYYIHQQIFARYSLERTVNGLSSVPFLYWDRPIEDGYNPRLAHSNGMPFIPRPDNIIPSEQSKIDVELVRLFERRLVDAIDSGALTSSNGSYVPINNLEGIDKLGKAFFGLPGTVNKHFYGWYYWQAIKSLGFLLRTNANQEFVGGAISTVPTALRDPLFYSYLNRMVSMFQIHKHHLKPYSEEELDFPKVHVESVDVEKLVTYFDWFEFEVTNAFYPEGEKTYKDYTYYVRQRRLNHKPYTYKIKVNSEVETDGMVRVFIGPKYDGEGHLMTVQQSRLSFVELDRFPVKIKSGENVYERNSKESPAYTRDPESFRSLYRRVKNAISSKEPFYVSEGRQCGVPDRIQLPKGKSSGASFRFFVMVTPYDKKFEGQAKDYDVACGSNALYDYKPLGYPFDRPVYGNYLFGGEVTNMRFADVKIYHRNEHDINRAITDED